MVEVIVERIMPDAISDACVAVLREKAGRRLLLIWIRRIEAESIAEAMQHVQPKRPLTHDLCKSIIIAMSGNLARVHITRVQDDTYYAQLLVTQNGDTVHIDARPSDSIAIAVRMNAPIFAQDDLLTDIEVPDGATISFVGTSQELTAEQLKAHLQKLRPEDFGKFAP